MPFNFNIQTKDWWKKISSKLLDSLSPNCNQSQEFTSEHRKGILSRLCLIIVAMVTAYFALAVFLFKVQVTNHDYYVNKATANFNRKKIIRPARGNIYDVNGNILATDQATLDVFAEPRRFEQAIPEVVEIMAQYLNFDAKRKRQMTIKFQQAAQRVFPVEISPSTSMSICKSTGAFDLTGIEIKENSDGTYRLNFYPARCNKEQKAQAESIFCRHFNWNQKQLCKKIQEQEERCMEIPIEWKASLEEAEQMLQTLKQIKLNGKNFAGVRYEESWKRNYPRGAMLANMLGFTNEKNRGVSGIEFLMDKYLIPQNGEIRYLKDKQGRPVENTEIQVAEAQNGADVYLTIVEPLQEILEDELQQLVADNNPRRAYAIMMDPSTGAIMALAQYPQFNPNDRTTMANPNNCQNHCLLQALDPGSVMKPLSLSTLLENHTANINTEVYCEMGRWVYGKRALTDGNHRYANLTLAEVIIKSSNIGTAKLCVEHSNDEAIYNNLANLGFGRKTGLGFYPANEPPITFGMEAKGIFRPLHEWKIDRIKITRVPIGQGVSCTPMQIIQAWSALANDGIMMQPYIVDKVIYSDGTVKAGIPHPKAHPLSKETCEQLKTALVRVPTADGTGRRAAIKGYTIAGKTGTAQIWISGDPKLKTKGYYSQEDYFASFIGFVPADKPRFLLLVSAERPDYAHHTGSNCSAPVFSRIAARALEYLQVEPDKK